MKKKINQYLNYFKTPRCFNILLLLMDLEEAPLIVEITQMAYSREEAHRAAQKLVDSFNYKYSCSYKIDRIWEMKRKISFTLNGKPVEHYQIDITQAGSKRNWDYMKLEYDFVQTHYVHKGLSSEG